MSLWARVARLDDGSVFAAQHDGPGSVEPQTGLGLFHSPVFFVGFLVAVDALFLDDRPDLLFKVDLLTKGC